MTSPVRPLAVLCLACLALTPLSAEEQTRATRRQAPAPAAPSAPATPSADEAPQRAKVVRYGERDVVALRAKLRFTTLIVLPANERILDAACGDKEFWTIDVVQNIAYVKPAKVGAESNLNLVAASGNIYSFLLKEVSERDGVQPDLTIYIEPSDASMLDAAGAAPRFASARDLEEIRQQAIKAKEETRAAHAATEAAIEAGVNRFITNVRFAYRFEAGKRPFYVRAMYHDDTFTYIQARPEETPALWEIRDGKPNLIEFQYRDGVYVVTKVLDKGYLAIGKSRLPFEREE